VTDSRARLLRAAVGFALVPADEPELRLLHRWLDAWPASLSADSPTVKLRVFAIRTTARERTGERRDYFRRGKKTGPASEHVPQRPSTV